MAKITRAVGRGVKNSNKKEVSLVQQLLNRHRKPPLRQISTEGTVGPETIGAIEEFQRRVVKMSQPDGRVDPNGTTLRLLSEGDAALVGPTPGMDPLTPATTSYWGPGPFSHPDAAKVVLNYRTQDNGKRVVQLNTAAENLLKSILASCGLKGAHLNSTLRTWHDQARITITQTYPKRGAATVKQWYGADVLEACEKYLDDIQAFADWWEKRNKDLKKLVPPHIRNRAMDVDPDGDRTKFVAKVKELKLIAGSGVYKIIPKGEMNEPVDHVEFTFDVT